MLYTGKGDKGQTGLYHCDQRLSKSSRVAEALGSLDEINSFLGWCKVKVVAESEVGQILAEAQNHLFSIQAELAGAPKKISRTAVTRAEAILKEIDKELPAIKNFIVPGGTEMSAMLDVARTIARRAERQAVAVAEAGEVRLSAPALAYLNRLSSLLYALARLANHRAGIKEEKPRY
jgi:cob(I)alamin adenosyltransferase